MKNHGLFSCLRILICLVVLTVLTTGVLQAGTVPLTANGVYWGTNYYDPDVTAGSQYDKDPVTGASPAWTLGSFNTASRSVTGTALRVDTSASNTSELSFRQTSNWDASQQTTIEFQLRVVSQNAGANNAGGVLFANGTKWQNFLIGTTQVYFADQPVLTGDFTQWTTFRITLQNMSTAPVAKLYINNNPVAVRTTTTFYSNSINYLQFGDGSTGQTGGIVDYDFIRWTSIDAIAPGQIKPSRSFFFCSSQLKYSLFQNYLDNDFGLANNEGWIDRPLFFDRTLRPSTNNQYFTAISFQRDINILKNYNVDGLMAYGYPASSLSLYQQALNNIQTIPITNFLTFPRIGLELNASTDNNFVTGLDSLIKAASSSASTWRPGGNVVVNTLNADLDTPQDIAALLSILRTQKGDTFLFVAELDILFGTTMLKEYNSSSNGSLTTAQINAAKAVIRSYLDVCDGIAVAPAHHMEHQGLATPYYYDARFNKDFYNNYLIPTVQSVLAEPAYSNKLLGMVDSVGYTNVDSGVNYSTGGTKRLRQILATASTVKPDFVYFDEWNEVNENTCIQPTVQGSLASERIIRYYAQTMKGQALTPLAGDDTTVPNLILSYRRVLKMGEALELELVNIPDGSAVSNNTISFTLSLKNMSGVTVATYPQVNWDPTILNEQTYTVATENMADAVLIPHLSVTYKSNNMNYENFHYIEVKPTWNLDYLTVRQSLRDIFVPTSWSFTGPSLPVTYPAGVPLQVQLSSTETLASVEILENRAEVYAYDQNNEFNLANNVIFYGQFLSCASLRVTGKIHVNNVSSFYFRSAERNVDNEGGYTVQSDGIQLNNQYVNTVPCEFFIAIPQSDVANGVFDLVLNGIGEVTVPMSTLNANGLYSQTLPNRVIVTLSKYKRLPDIPVPVGSNSVNFNCTVYPEGTNPIYHLRAITTSGKIFQSPPIQPVSFTDGNPTSFNFFSETTQSVSTASIGANLIPDINYTLGNLCGDALTSSAETRWNGLLGAGLAYAEPMNNDPTYPPGAINSKPTLTSDGYLSFDGVGNYVNFPRETFPRGSFSLIFEIMPTSTNNQVLFRHYGLYVCSLMLKISNQQLVATFVDSNLATTTFATGLSIPANTWSKVQVDYDQNTIKFTVTANGTPSSYTQTFSKHALYYGECVFGGLLKGMAPGDQYFQGLLKSFRVVHNVLP